MSKQRKVDKKSDNNKHKRRQINPGKDMNLLPVLLWDLENFHWSL